MDGPSKKMSNDEMIAKMQADYEKAMKQLAEENKPQKPLTKEEQARLERMNGDLG